MAHLFKQLNYEIALAHCNFQLRVREFGDQHFVADYAEANAIHFF
jgi:tRNA(Ile)-lysidine synthase